MTPAPDLPCDDDSAGLAEYADTVANAIGGRRGLIVVAQSFGGFTAPLVHPVATTRLSAHPRTRRPAGVSTKIASCPN
jgi:hypothetical protein